MQPPQGRKGYRDMCETGQESIQKQRTQQIQMTAQVAQQTAAPQQMERERQTGTVHVQGEAMGSLVMGQFPPAPPADPPQDPPQPAAEQHRAAKTKQEKKQEKRAREAEKKREKEREREEKAAHQQREKEEKERALEREALGHTRRGEIVKNTPDSSWEQNGGASTHLTLPKKEALEVVKKSKGFLFARPVSGSKELLELRPTLPETLTVKIDGKDKKIAFRETYILFVKSLCAALLDKDGNVIRENLPLFEEMGNAVHDPSDPEGTVVPTDESALLQLLQKGMNALFPQKEAAKRFKELTKIMGAYNAELGFELNGGYSFFQSEAHRSLQGLAGFLKNSPLDLAQHLHKIETAVGSGEPLPDGVTLEQLKSATQSFHADVASALEELKDIRNMRLDSKEVPLPNACSGTGAFISDVNRMLDKKLPQRGAILYQHFQYSIENHYVPEKVEECLRLRAARASEENRAAYEEELRRYSELKRRRDLNPDSLSKEDTLFMNACVEHSSTFLKQEGKYEYHVAGNIRTEHNGAIYTVECFAAETKQAFVSPFTLHGAVGRYKGASRDLDRSSRSIDGMVRYYNQDNPLPSGEEATLSRLKAPFMNSALPGDATVQ